MVISFGDPCAPPSGPDWLQTQEAASRIKVKRMRSMLKGKRGRHIGFRPALIEGEASVEMQPIIPHRIAFIQPLVVVPRGQGRIQRRNNMVQNHAADEPCLHAGIPVKDYRADVRIIPVGSGCTISWRSTFHRKYPLSGTPTRLFLKYFLRDTARRLARAAQHRAAEAPAPPTA